MTPTVGGTAASISLSLAQQSISTPYLTPLGCMIALDALEGTGARRRQVLPKKQKRRGGWLHVFATTQHEGVGGEPNSRTQLQCSQGNEEVDSADLDAVSTEENDNSSLQLQAFHKPRER